MTDPSATQGECDGWLNGSGGTDEVGIPHVCLATRDRFGAYTMFLPWECGNPGQQQDSITAIELTDPVHDLLWICENGTLRSCRDDADCDGTNPNSPIDDSDFREPLPHSGGHRFCNRGFCASSWTHTCCSDGYRGQRPFEAVEARLLRRLMDNVTFAFVLDMHAARNDLTLRCSEFGGGCIAGNLLRITGNGITENAALAYNDASGDHWEQQTTLWNHVVTSPFLDLLSIGPRVGGSGQLPAWAASPSAAVVDDQVTMSNFDNDTYRGIPSFTWELGPRLFDANWDQETRDAWGALVRCDSTGTTGGKRPRTRVFLENQLEGAKALIDYLSRQAEVPNAGRHLDNTWIVPSFRDLGLAGLRIQDGHGRGVRQIETRYHGISGDPHAVTVIPAGDWVVSLDVLAADTNLMAGDISADFIISLAAKPSTSPLPLFATVDAATVSGFYGPFSRTEVGRRFRFEAGTDYRVIASFPDPSQLPSTDVESNNYLAAKVRVVACNDAANRPNGLSADEFCQEGLPFADDRFECYPFTGRCRECWADQPCEGIMPFCIFGMCDSPATCWSANVEDEPGGITLAAMGLGTHTWQRTMHRNDGSQDEDSFHIYADPLQVGPVHSTWELTVHVRNLCSLIYLLPQDEFMEEVHVRVEQKSTSTIGWDVLEDWTEPMKLGGLTVGLGSDKVAALYNGRPLRISVTNPTLESFPYRLTARLEFAGVGPFVPGPGDIQADVNIGIQDTADVNIELGNYESFVPVPDPPDLAGQWLFFRPDEDLSPRLIHFDLYSARGQFLRSGVPLDGGLGISLDELPEGMDPFSGRLYSDEGMVRGAVYLCPTTTVDCLDYDPMRNSCGDFCDDPADLCCIDHATGARVCADIENDPDNCGGCGVACEWDEVCLEGVCARGQGRSCWETVCPDGLYCVSEHWLTRRNPKCRALLVDNENCGWLGNVCAANRHCVMGLCLPRCGMECDGGCGPDTCCWVLGQQVCVDTTTSFLHCGACGRHCAFGEVCEGGACVPWYEVYDPCPFGLVNCGRNGVIECKNLAGDPENCGGCGGRCGDGATCVQGACVMPAGESAVVDD